MQSVSTSPFHLTMLRKHNTWYTIKDGDWSDPAIWMGNGTKRYSYPQVGDTVYINHSVAIDRDIQINNIYISGSLKGSSLSGYTTTVNGDLQVSASGMLDLSLQFNNLILNGYNNIIPTANFSAGSSSTVTYNGSFDQFLLNIPYNNLTTQNGKKYQISDITVGGNFNQQSNYEVGAYNLTVNGSSTLGAVGSYLFSKNSSTGSILFVGSADFEGSTDLSIGNPNVEFRGGFTIHTFQFISGTGTFTFSTNDQTVNFAAYLGGSWNANIIVSGAIILTWAGTSNMPVNGTINGTVSGSTFNNSGSLFLGNSTTPMTTGVFNYQFSTTSILGYSFSGNFTLPYSTYANLVIGGSSGTKSLGANTTINQTLTIGSNTTTGVLFDCAGYNLDVKGAFNCYHGLRCSAFCNITFEGLASFLVGVGGDFSDLRGGNPNIEFKNGLTIHSNGIFSGTGTFKFSTNNQTIDFSVLNGGALASNWVISGAITVKFIDGATSSPGITGTIDGDNSASVFDVRGVLQYQNTTAPMSTGLLYCNQAANTFVYGASGSQGIAVPSDGGYYNLTVSSVTGTLTGNTVINNNLTINGTLELSTYNITCLGTTTYNGTFSKTGAGTVNLNVINSGSSSAVLAFTGNPAVNLSGNFTGDGTAGLNFGTSTVNVLQSITFSTWMSGTGSTNLTTNFLIASGKTFTNAGLTATTGGVKTTGIINGADATAVFDNRSICVYKNSQQPMQTGKLYCNQATNTFVYGAGNQDITPPSDPTPGYKNLTLNGSGTKKLLGNISVKGTYTLTSPATLNSNGFTLTNP